MVQGLVDLIRKIVVIVLVLELILQLQPGKDYEPYLKLFVGLFVVFALVRGIHSGISWSGLEVTLPMDVFEWSAGNIKEEVGTSEIEIPINHIEIEKIEIERIGHIP